MPKRFVMFHPAYVALTAVAFCTATCCTATCEAQLPQVSNSRLGVDSVTLTSGERLYGFILDQHSDRSVEFAVDRNWLQSTYPTLAADFVKFDNQRTQRIYEQKVQRIQRWMDARRDDQGLLIFLEKELAKFEFLKSDANDSKWFVRIALTADAYREMVIQPPERRKIAGLAWQHQLDSPTTTPVSLLEKQLVAKGIDLKTAKVNLVEQVSPAEENDRQWAARKAIVEYQHRKSLEYQGTGSVLLRKSQSPDLGALVGQMLGSGGGLDAISQLGAELGLPEFKRPQASSDWWKQATGDAEREGFCGVLITRMQQSQLSSEVVVELSFFAMEKPGEWIVAKQLKTTANADQQTAERLQQIQSDPQIKTVLDTLEGLGLSKDQSLIHQALQHGAATQQALQNAQGLFNEFLLQYTRNLDGPPVPVVAAT